jgi:hypothetical protein
MRYLFIVMYTIMGLLNLFWAFINPVTMHFRISYINLFAFVWMLVWAFIIKWKVFPKGFKYKESIYLVCINDFCETKGLTKGKIYELISIEDSMGLLYKIKDDKGIIKRYSPDFFEKIN